MKKKFLCLMLTLVMVFSLVPSAVAANDEATQAAQTLYELGLFRGTGTNPDGTPIFALEQTPTRNQAVIMLVRLLGKEEEALAGNWELPFADVAKGSTAYPYIGYASDQVDGTFVVGSLLGTNYASGLAIGGGSGNLLWKGTKVATTSDIPTFSFSNGVLEITT